MLAQFHSLILTLTLLTLFLLIPPISSSSPTPYPKLITKLPYCHRILSQHQRKHNQGWNQVVFVVELDEDEKAGSEMLVVSSNYEVEVLVGTKEGEEMEKKKECDRGLKCLVESRGEENRKVIKVVVKKDESTSGEQTVIICIQTNSNLLLQPITTGLHIYTSPPSATPTPTLYLLSPSTHRLSSTFKILQGYPIIFPYICPEYDLKPCLSSLHKQIHKLKQQYRSNYLLALSVLQLRGEEVMDIDYCQRCFMVVWVEGVVGGGGCQVGVWVGGRRRRGWSWGWEIQRMSQGKFKRIQQMNSTNSFQQYQFTSLGDTEFLFQSNSTLSTVYYTCSHLPQTYKISLNSHNNLLLNLQNPHKPSPISCQFNLQPTSNSTIYYTNFALRSLPLNTSHLTKITRSHPATFHFPHPNPNLPLYLNFQKCIDSPLTLTYYYLPDYHLISNRNKTQDQQDKDVEDWVYKKTVRIVEHFGSVQLELKRDFYASQNVVLEIQVDSYVVVEVEVGGRRYGGLGSIGGIGVVEEFYEEEQDGGILFSLTFQIPGNVEQKQIKQHLQIITSNKPDEIWLQTFCKSTLFQQPPSQSISHPTSPQQTHPHSIHSIHSIQNPTPNTTTFKLTSKSNYPYIGLSLSLPQNGSVLYTVVDLNGKIDLFVKYRWVGVGVFGGLGLVGLGVGMLVRTRARKDQL